MNLISELRTEFMKVSGGNELVYIIRWSEANTPFAKELGKRIYENIVDLISHQGWASDTVKRFLSGISVEAVGTYVVVKSKNKIFNILENGRQASKPRKESKRPVPIKLPNGAIIFRRITFKSIYEGKWRSPARPGLKIIETAIKYAISDIITVSEIESPIIFEKLRQLIKSKLSLT